MESSPAENMDTEAIRCEHLCRGCGGHKDVGLLVCDRCFKWRDDVVPMKYWAAGVSDWLSYLTLPSADKRRRERANAPQWEALRQSCRESCR